MGIQSCCRNCKKWKESVVKMNELLTTKDAEIAALKQEREELAEKLVGTEMFIESCHNDINRLNAVELERDALRDKYAVMMREFTVLYGIASTVMNDALLEEVLKEVRNGQYESNSLWFPCWSVGNI